MANRACLFAALLAVGGGWSSSPALATGTIVCHSPARDDVTVEINVGQLPALIPIWARIRIGATAWTSLQDDEGTPVAMLQAFDDGEAIRIDVADANLEEILFKVRLFRAIEGRTTAHAGTLWALGLGAHELICEGP